MMKYMEYFAGEKPGKDMEYLTDADLEQLIAEVEQNELMPAPPDLQDQILETLGLEEQSLEKIETSGIAARELEEQRRRDKIIEYKRYRFRVLTTVAAAVAVVFLLPRFEQQQGQDEFFKTFLEQDFTWEIRQEAKAEVPGERYETKDEMPNDSGIMEAIRGGVNIFANNNRWNLFKK